MSEKVAKDVCWQTNSKREIIMFNSEGSLSKPDIILNEDLQLRLLHLLLDIHNEKLEICFKQKYKIH